MDNDNWFPTARYGMIVHYGLYSLLERGEWVMNKEQIPLAEYAALARRFTAAKFDADDLVGRAKRDWGMRYAVLTCKHHDGFCLYDSKLTDFTTAKTAAKRDLVREFVEACRRHGLRIGLYHSLNDWSVAPNAVDAIERPQECHDRFIEFVHGQIREIMTNYGKIDVMWYDGWWPFDANGWQADQLNAMVRQLQPGILVNGRSGRRGDFDTPEGHLTASDRPWEGCMTLNNSWGFHRGDHNWKTAKTVASMLQQVAAGAGNLLLNVGPRGDGSIPAPTIDILNQTGAWLKVNGEAIHGSERFRLNLRERGDERADWTHHGGFTAHGNAFYLHVANWPGTELVITGVECRVTEVSILGGETYPFTQQERKVRVTGLPADPRSTMPVVIRFRTADRPVIYRSGGYRDPAVAHCRYDPCPSDLQG